MGVLEQIKGQLIVSCQADAGSPLRDSWVMAAFARAAEVGGAGGIRASGPEDIAAIRAAVKLPIIGIYKQQHPGCEVYITPTLQAAREVVAAGADILALDATDRLRPGDVRAEAFIQNCKSELEVPIMADISTLAEGIAAAEAGVDLVATTMAGYTPYSPSTKGPDFDLLRELLTAVSVPVVVEGRVNTPEDAAQALKLGAHAVVVGTAITRTDVVTRWYVDAIHSL